LASLRLDALGRVHQQHRALARGQRPGHLVGEVDVPGGVDEVQHELAAVLAGPGQADGLALDRDAALALDVHPVQVLGTHLPLADHAGELQHAVRERGLAVVDVGDDAEIADQRLIGTARLGLWWQGIRLVRVTVGDLRTVAVYGCMPSLMPTPAAPARRALRRI
jgi:hypothetical protein